MKQLLEHYWIIKINVWLNVYACLRTMKKTETTGPQEPDCANSQEQSLSSTPDDLLISEIVR